MPNSKEDLEKLKILFESYKEPSKNIMLSRHPKLKRYLMNMFNPKSPSLEELKNIQSLDESIHSDLKSIAREQHK
jgi:flagellar basal body-associated protein FliL